jgi:molybdopterin/thiamine biosynthesis adenylyltransferase
MDANPLPDNLHTTIARLATERATMNPPALSLEETCSLATTHTVSRRQVEIAALEAHVLPERYRRNLGTVGWEGQVALLRATVGVVGAGGLGGWILEALARMGVGHLLVVDGDTFQENNLNRQLGCTEEVLGQLKATVLAKRLATVNGAVEVSAHATWLTAENAATLLAGSQVIVDALDTLPARLLLEDTARAMGVPLVHGAIGGYSGQVMTVFPDDPGLRGLYGERPPERGIETVLGNPSATPMMISAWQTQEVVKLIIGQGTPLRQRLLMMDAKAGEVTEVSLS